MAAAALFGAAATAVLTAAPAAAHPFGPPQTAQISGHGQRVEVRWSASGDDLTALGLHLGVLGEERTFVYQDGALVPEESDPGDAELLAEAPQLVDYLLEHVGVTQGGAACTGEVTDTDDVESAGVGLVFDCAGAVDDVEVTISTLTDVHPAYRTLATGPDGQRAAYTQESPRHGWQLGGDTTETTPMDGAVVPLAVATVVAAGAGLGWAIARRRTIRRVP